MKKKRYIALILILSLLSMNKAYAACTQEEISGFEDVEDEYKITYEFNKETKDYTLKFSSPKPDMYDYVIYSAVDFECKDLDEDHMKSECYNVPINEYILEIVGQTDSCNDVLKTFTLKLPDYNNFSEDPACEGIEEFYLCQPTSEEKVDYDTFISRVNTYKRTKAEKEELVEQKKEGNNELLEEVMSYIKENLIQIIIIAVFIVLVVISTIVTYKSVKKSRRLE